VIAVIRSALWGLLRGSPLLLAATVGVAGALDAGTRHVTLHAKDGSRVDIGDVTFTPRPDGRIGFMLKVDTARFADHFLSMREFKCLPGSTEILCWVPYPYANPSHVGANDLAWLEHALLFMFKKPSEFGAQLWNGVYFELSVDGNRLVGTPQAVDLNRISAPPERGDVPPYGPKQRDAMQAGARWFQRLTIE
jgi:hypothetical protein